MKKSEAIQVVSDDHFELTKTGLKVKGKPTYEECVAFGRVLFQIEGALMWWVGDWQLVTEQRYGDKYEQAYRQKCEQHKERLHAEKRRNCKDRALLLCGQSSCALPSCPQATHTPT